MLIAIIVIGVLCVFFLLFGPDKAKESKEPFVPYGDLQLAKQAHKNKAPITKVPHCYIVFDIETTGLSRTQDRIIEIAATKYTDGSPVETYHQYVNPGCHIPNFITRLTGVRNSDVAQSPGIMDVKSDFVRFVGTTPLVGHNIKTFDIPFLEAQMGHVFPNQIIDTLSLSRKAFPGLPNYKLTTLNHILGLSDLEAHRAENDIVTNNALLYACFSPKRYAKRISDPSLLETIPVDPSKQLSRPDIHAFSPSNPEGPATMLTGKLVVFSGELNLLPEEAYQVAVDAGAVLKTVVSKKVDYLILGHNDPKFLGEDGLCSKERTARKLIESGDSNIQIIDEKSFLHLSSTLV